MLHTRIALLDDLLAAHADALGGDAVAYRNHTYRVANLCAALAPAGDLRKIAVAAAWHDLGIWTDGSFDYLPPSIRGATAWLAGAGLAGWTDEIAAMIAWHHKLTPWRGDPAWLVDAFGRADWADVSRGLVAAGVPRGLLRELYATWPGAGFHRRLVAFEIAHLRRHPLNPLPMFRL